MEGQKRLREPQFLAQAIPWLAGRAGQDRLPGGLVGAAWGLRTPRLPIGADEVRELQVPEGGDQLLPEGLAGNQVAAKGAVDFRTTVT
jgi:hypothetical protein